MKTSIQLVCWAVLLTTISLFEHTYFYILKVNDDFLLNYKQCLSFHVNKVADYRLHYYMPRIVDFCLNSSLTLNISELANKDETKFHIFHGNPSQRQNVLVTLGIGMDVEAERLFIKALHGNVDWFGADPIWEGNCELVRNLSGTFIPAAVSALSTYSEASVLPFGATPVPPPRNKDEWLAGLLGNRTNYIRRRVASLGIQPFLRDFVRKPIVDALWIDIEGAEYPLLQFIATNQFKDMEIIVCQINMEIHRPNKEQKIEIYQMITTLMNPGGDFVLLKALDNVNFRVFMANFENEECYLYIKSFFSKERTLNDS